MSSSLQIGLAIGGGLILAAVVAHGAWTARRHAPRQAEPPVREPREPAADDAPAERQEPVLAAPLDAALAAPPASRPRDGGLDPLIDAVAPIGLDGVVSGDAVLAALPPTRRAGTKPFAIEGQHETTGLWERPRPGRRYRALQAGVQLATRHGPLNEIEFSEFVMKTQAFADAVGGAPDFPDMLHEVARARELDQFAGAHDAQLGFTLRARSAAWSPGYVQQHAARLGFVPGAVPGRLVLPAVQEGAAPLLGLSFDTQAALSDDPALSAILEVTLSLDVPHVPRSEQPFVRLREAAAALAQAMDGVITDDHGRPLPAEALDAIGADLESLYDALDARDLSAGSAQARRLFS